MTYKEILYAINDNILTLTLNRPDKLNAYTAAMHKELVAAFAEASRNDEVRVVVVTGAGRGFCAGADLSGGVSAFDMESRTDRPERKRPEGQPIDWSADYVRDMGGRLTLAIFECLKPIIAAVNGPAVGIGATMQLAMDIRIASDKARFGFVFARRGIVPEACSSWFLPRIVGLSQALEWCFTGRVFGAEEALGARLVKEVVPPEKLLARAYEIAGEIRDNTAPVSVALTRQMLWRLSALDHPMEAHKIDSRNIYARGMSEDVKEGILSFLEKRPAQFPEKVSKDMPTYFPWWKERDYD